MFKWKKLDVITNSIPTNARRNLESACQLIANDLGQPSHEKSQPFNPQAILYRAAAPSVRVAVKNEVSSKTTR